MPSSRKTQHMGLNLWDENDYLTSHDLNADNQKIDDALAGQVTPPYIGTDGFWYVFDLSKKEYVKTAYPARGEKGAQGEPGAKGETGATGAKGDTGNPLHVAGSFDTLEQLQAAHPDGDGQNSYLVQGYVYVWNGMSWEKTNISGAGKYSDLPDKPSIGGVELAGDKSVHDIGAALSVDAFIPCVSAYDATAKRHTLTPLQVSVVLPEVFTVRFMATAGFKAGDKVALAGVEYTPAYTDSNSAVEAGVWQVGAEVILTCRKTDKKVFVGKALSNKLNNTGDALFALLDSFAPVEMRRTIFRGKNLGASVTAEQKANIKNGSFKELFLGDYWSIGGKTWRIADFNYWLNCGDIATLSNHLVIMPDNVLYNHVMNDTNITTGGYVGSKMYTEGLSQAKTIIASAFPGIVLSHRELLVNGVTNGYPSAGAWYDSTVELPNEIMIYGSHVFAPAGNGTTITYLHTIDNSQLALMAAYPRFIKIRETYRLRDVASAAYFAFVGRDGYASAQDASYSLGVRPVFAIGQLNLGGLVPPHF